MPQERREERQLRLDVGILAIPTQQRLQNKAMADIVKPGRAPKRFAVKTTDVAQAIKPSPDGVRARSCSRIRQEERVGVLGVRA
jgi:hypothetical protein